LTIAEFEGNETADRRLKWEGIPPKAGHSQA
jgi:hypothetical protein